MRIVGITLTVFIAIALVYCIDMVELNDIKEFHELVDLASTYADKNPEAAKKSGLEAVIRYDLQETSHAFRMRCAINWNAKKESMYNERYKNMDHKRFLDLVKKASSNLGKNQNADYFGSVALEVLRKSIADEYQQLTNTIKKNIEKRSELEDIHRLRPTQFLALSQKLDDGLHDKDLSDKQAEEALLKKIDRYYEIYEGKESLGKKLFHKAEKKVHQLKSTRKLSSL